MLIYLSLLIAAVGLVLYLALPGKPIARIGEHMFWTGLLAFQMAVASGRIVHFP